MIEMLPDMPPGVTGVRVSGRLSGQELREVRPTLEKSLKSGEIRIVEVIDSDYQGFGPGGLVEDLKLGLGAVPAAPFGIPAHRGRLGQGVGRAHLARAGLDGARRARRVQTRRAGACQAVGRGRGLVAGSRRPEV